MKGDTGADFVAWDRRLESEGDGVRWLAQPDVADVVVESIGSGEKSGKFRLDAFVVMPNHVHILFFPLVEMASAVRGMKGASARRANQVLGRTGARLWQEESFDHWVRNATEWQSIVRYIERNPVRAGLSRNPEDYRW